MFFCKYRALFADCSPALYVFIDTHIPYFGLNRYSTFINYIFPCFLSLFDVPISVIIYSFGINYLLLPIIVFVFLKYKQKSIKYEMLFLVSFAFFNTYTFYYSLHDYWTGFYLFFILIRLVDDTIFDALKYKNHLVVLLNLLIINSHSSMLFPLFTFYIFYFLFKKNSNRTPVFYAVSVVVLYAIYNIVFSMNYDKLILSGGSDFFYELINLPNSVMFTSFMDTFSSINSFYLLSILLTILILTFKRRFILLLFFIFYVFVSFLLFIFYFKDFEYTIYSEGQLKAVTTLIPIIIVFIFYEYVSKKLVLLFCVVCYIFSSYMLFKGSDVVTSQYSNIKQLLSKFDSNVFLTSQKPNCPLESISISRQSFFINKLEYNKPYCIFSNIGDNNFVNIVIGHWIKDNIKQTNPHLKFPNDIKYLNADSLGVNITDMYAIYPNSSCDEMINRLSK